MRQRRISRECLPPNNLRLMNKSVLDVVHNSAKDLKNAGVMDDVTMREFDALCLPPVKEFSAAQIKRIRQKTKASQGVFAHYLNTSLSTVHKWEQGAKRRMALQ